MELEGIIASEETEWGKFGIEEKKVNMKSYNLKNYL